MVPVIATPEITVVKLHGPFNAANAATLQTQLTTAVQSSIHSTVVVDMEQVELLDSAGLMALVAALSLAQRLNKRFRLSGVSPAIRIMFEITQLDRVFEIFETRAAFEAVIS